MKQEDKIAKAREMRAGGATIKEIMRHFNMRSSNAVSRWLDDDLRQRQLAQQRRRRLIAPHGVCIDCGGKTSRARNKKGFSLRCAKCHVLFLGGNLIWTREAIIAAIQRFAQDKGRPPTMLDWRRADRENGYPNAKSVAGPRREFPTWADAIEEAGFPRPGTGRYERTVESEALRAERISGARRKKDEKTMDEALPVVMESMRTRYSGAYVQPPDDVARRAPPTEKFAGDVDAHRLLETFDCQAYGCLRDAEPGKQFCAKHLD